MIKKIFVFICLFMTIGVTSCLKDKTIDADSNGVPEFALDGVIDSIYVGDKGQILTINSPKIINADLSKVAYIWEVDGKIVSTDERLVYRCTSFGEHLARLTIDTGNQMLHRIFTIRVSFAYEAGVYALVTENRKTILTYVSDRDKGQKVIKDAFRQANGESWTLGTTPLRLSYFRFLENNALIEQLYLSTDNPAYFYRIQPDTMNVVHYFNRITTPVTYIARQGFPEDKNGSNGAILYTTNHLLYNPMYYDTGILVFSNTAILVDDPSNVEEVARRKAFDNEPVADMTTPTYNYNNRSFGVVYFNTKRNYILHSTGYRVDTIAKNIANSGYVYSGTFTTKKVISVLRNTDNTTYKMFFFMPGTMGIRPVVPKSMIKEGVRIDGIIGDAVFAAIRNRETLLCAVGNQVKLYDPNSEKTVDLVLPISLTTGKIVKMIVSDDSKKLIIGLNSSEDIGSFYVFNIEDLNAIKLIWKAEKVTGKVVDMIYRPGK